MEKKKWRVVVYVPPYTEDVVTDSAEMAELVVMNNLPEDDCQITITRLCDKCERINNKTAVRCRKCGAKL